jgi:hypothetical protein
MKCLSLTKLGDDEVNSAVWKGDLTLSRAYQRVINKPTKRLLTPAQRSAKRSAAAKARWARYTPEKRAQIAEKIRAAQLARLKPLPPSLIRAQHPVKMSKVVRAKISAAQKARWASRTPEQRAAIGANIKAAILAKSKPPTPSS